MNYTSFIVKIVGQPQQSFFPDQTSVTEVLVKFAPIRNNKAINIFQISICGKLASDVAKYYQKNDYIIIEGYISLRKNLSNNLIIGSAKQIEISVFKIYPFPLTSDFKKNLN